MSSYRLPKGGLIDRQTALTFSFDGKTFNGCPGDTLASALLANGVRLMGRSFKYHRPRGVVSAGSEEPNALVELREGNRREPNTRATTIELYDGLVARSQNRWPSLAFDLLAVNGLFSPIFVAGFYYKTFMWPAKAWEKVFEPAIRRAAGMGRASLQADPDTYDLATAHCDVLIIGTGPAGLAAALAAARAGARVIVCEEDHRPGGRLLSDEAVIDGQPGAAFVAATLAELTAHPRVRVMTRTTVFGVYDGGTYGAIERVADHLKTPAEHQPRQALWHIVAKRAVLAAGAIERPLIFPGNDRPGVMLAQAARTFAGRYAVSPGRRVAVFTNNDEGWRSAVALQRAGVEVTAVIDPRADVDRNLAGAHDLRLVSGEVIATQGRQGLSGVTVRLLNGQTEHLSIDTLAMSGGHNPNIGLTSHHGARPAWREDIAAFVPNTLPPGLSVAGAANGAFGLGAALAEGFARGRQAAAETGHEDSAGTAPTATDTAYRVTPLWQVKTPGKAFVDFQHDVTADDIALAEREGYRAVEHLKRYTTLGMATDQGKLSNVNGLAIMAELTGRGIAQTGTTLYRPPVVPVAMSAFSGRSQRAHFRPTRLPPSHAWAAEQGAQFMTAGAWLRAAWFAKPGETHWRQTLDREVLAVRAGVGICDVSTLGKIDIQGPGATELLQKVYANPFGKLAVGRTRYGIMLREDGFVFDDGTTARLGEDHYLMTTTTANAGKVMQHLDFCRQVLWPELDVHIASVTDQFGQFAVAGPKSRELLAQVVDAPFDLSNEAFPFMACAELTVCGGVPARLFRISFSGELAYELAVPARYGDALVRELMRLGAPLGVVPYGLEALNVMRVEKGHVVGSELTGTTTALDLGFGGMQSLKKDHIGRWMSQRPHLLSPEREQLVGLKPVNPSEAFMAGAHVVPRDAQPTAANDHGFVTSVAHSPMLGHCIALAMVRNGRQRMGEIVRVVDLVRNQDVLVEICHNVFFDPQGERLHG